MTVTKASLIQSLFENEILNKAEAARVVDTLFEIIKTNLATGEDILISGFGKWMIKSKRERRGRNPQTGQDLTIDPRRVVTFRASGVLRRLINK